MFDRWMPGLTWKEIGKLGLALVLIFIGSLAVIYFAGLVFAS